MRVHTLSLTNFRNYAGLELPLSEGLNLFTGENAQGKTNLLEAVFLCALGRSHRTKADADMVRQGYDTAKVKLAFSDRLGKREISIELNRGMKKRVRVDAKFLARSAEQMGVFNAVMFSPEDLSLVKDGPGERRRFMDMELSQMRPSYCFALQAYARAHKQRNALLKLSVPLEEHLCVWERQMAEAAAIIAPMRGAFVARLNELAGEIHASVCRGKELLAVEYESCLKEQMVQNTENQSLQGKAYRSDYMEAFANELKRRRAQDLRRGITTFGLHREDLNILINGDPARMFASQGQQRTAALSLKLSEIALVRELTENQPVVLLDDVLSELDEHRRELLFTAIDSAQILVTCTGAEGFRPVAAKTYVVREGTVKEDE